MNLTFIFWSSAYITMLLYSRRKNISHRLSQFTGEVAKGERNQSDWDWNFTEFASKTMRCGSKKAEDGVCENT